MAIENVNSCTESFPQRLRMETARIKKTQHIWEVNMKGTKVDTKQISPNRQINSSSLPAPGVAILQSNELLK